MQPFQNRCAIQGINHRLGNVNRIGNVRQWMVDTFFWGGGIAASVLIFIIEKHNRTRHTGSCSCAISLNVFGI